MVLKLTYRTYEECSLNYAFYFFLFIKYSYEKTINKRIA